MSDATNKPRDIKNLKARLGKTVTPGQIAQPPGQRAPSVPPLGGSAPPFGAPVPRPASMPPGKGSAPAFGAPAPRPMTPAAGSIPAPSFAQPKAAPAAAAPAAAPRKADPFAAPAGARVVPPEHKQVRLVIDDSAVNESEIGRRSLVRGVVVAAVGVALGIALGYGVGSTVGDRNLFKSAVRDGKEIYAKVQEVSKTVETAKKGLKDALDSMGPGAGGAIQINYGAIEGLIALPKPFSGNDFHRKKYGAFQPGTVDDLFDYYNNINIMWGRFAGLVAKTTKSKREVLDKSAKATDELMNAQYGLNPFMAQEMMFGRLVYVTIPPPAEGEEGLPETVQVSSTQGGRAVDKTRYAGQPEIAEKPDNFVILIEKGQSMAILGQPANAFRDMRAEFLELNAIMTKTLEAQGRLLKELGQIATLSD
jgi:hypothetical protein